MAVLFAKIQLFKFRFPQEQEAYKKQGNLHHYLLQHAAMYCKSVQETLKMLQNKPTWLMCLSFIVVISEIHLQTNYIYVQKIVPIQVH